MRFRIHAAFVLSLALALARPVAAQGISAQCPPGSFKPNGDPDNTKIAQDACQKAIDLFQYMAPQLGALLAGGNATQGLTGTLGGLGHFAVGVRGNGIRGALPEVDRVVPATGGAQQSTYTVTEPLMGLPTGDFALGIFGGLPLGLTKIGGLDFLLSASYLPSYNNASVDVAVPAGSWKFGYGGKIGLLQESALVPGVSVSFLTRELPLVNITGRAGEDRLVLDSIRIKTNSWRAVAGKSFILIGGAVGLGQDSYDSNARIRVTVAPRPASEGGSGGPVSLQQKLTRTNYFASLWINAQVLRIVGELGQASGGEILTYNQFDGPRADGAKKYFSVGVSMGW
jgi:hypothetical protein